MSDGFTLCSGCAELRQDKQAMRYSHAEFVQVVKSLCVDKFLHRHEKLEVIESLCDRALCDAELAKEQPK